MRSLRGTVARVAARRPEMRGVPLFIYLVSAVGVLGVSFVSPVLPVMAGALSLTDGQLGLVVTAYTAPVVAFVPLFGWLSDRVGRRVVIAGGLVTFGTAGLAIASAATFRTILALRVVQGIGFSAMMPLTTALLGDLFEGRTELGAQGLRVTFISMGAAVFPVLGGVLAGAGWEVPFVAFAAAIPIGFLAIAVIPADAGRPTPEHEYLRAVAAGARDPFVASALAVGFARFFVRYGLLAYLPLLAARRTLTTGEVGLVVGLIGAAKMVVASQSRRTLGLGRPPVVMATGLLAGSLAVGALSLPQGLASFALVAVAFGALDGMIAPLQKSVVTQRVGEAVRGGVVSVNDLLQNLGKTLGPALLGLFVVGVSLPTSFVLLGALGVGAAVVVLVAVWHLDAPGADSVLAEPSRQSDTRPDR